MFYIFDLVDLVSNDELSVNIKDHMSQSVA